MAVVPGGEGKGSRAHALFTVTASAAPVALPTPQATIRSIEFGFRGPSTLHDGELVRFENEGFLVHMDVAFPVKNMKAARQAVKDLLAGKEKAVGKLIVGTAFGFAGPLSHEAFQQETITAKPGIYVEVCFMDTQDGRGHTCLAWSESSRSPSSDAALPPHERQRAPARAGALCCVRRDRGRSGDVAV